MIIQGQGQQKKLPPFTFVSKIAKVSNDKYYINILPSNVAKRTTVSTDQAAQNNN
jgi:hypothetical protein